MKKRTSRVSRRIVSLLMSLVLTLTLVTPAAFATEVVGGSGTAIIEGNANPADANPNEDTEGKDDENKDTEHGGDEQPTNPGDEDKNPGEGEGDDANKPDEDKKDEAPDGENKDEENKNGQPTEDENNGDDEIALLNAENAADVWDGTGDTDWHNYEQTTFEISTAEQLAGLAQLVNDGTNFSGKTIKLTADIDLNNQAWTPIGNENGVDAELVFSGTFDGDGYTVSGLNVPDTYFPGLFGQISTNAKVQNLIVKGSVTGGGVAFDIWGEAAGVAAYNDGYIQNCGFYGTVTGSSDGSVSVYGLTGGVGGGTVKNCWYFKEVGSGADDVCGGPATNCVMISSADPMKAAKLETLKTAAPDTGKVWSWKAGDAYPTLIDPPKTITMQPIFPDCAAVVTAGETVLNAENKYTCEVTGDTVTITVSGSGEPIYCTANEGENAYTTEGENANLTELKSGSTTFNKNDLPKTYYYGTEEDFRLLAAWNSAVSGKNVSITEANQLKALARMVNSGKDSMAGKTIMLGADIRLNNDAVPTSGNQWTPIGTEKNPFKGTFTGYSRSGGYAAISGLSGDLFGVVDNSKTKIQYVTISGGKGRLVPGPPARKRVSPKWKESSKSTISCPFSSPSPLPQAPAARPLWLPSSPTIKADTNIPSTTFS